MVLVHPVTLVNNLGHLYILQWENPELYNKNDDISIDFIIVQVYFWLILQLKMPSVYKLRAWIFHIDWRV